MCSFGNGHEFLLSLLIKVGESVLPPQFNGFSS